MPRLSIIIPHRGDDQRLEETILSVLENRPRDCEVLVVHNGSYRDPYELTDELVYVQEDPKSTVVELLNAGLMAACSPVVCTLLDGAVVSASWAEPALKRFAATDVAAVAPQLQVGRSAISGISSSSIRHAASLRIGRVESKDGTAAAPTLAAGFYRRKSLLALDGWNEELGIGSVDVELAIMMTELGMHCECEPQVVIHASVGTLAARRSAITISELAGIAAAHGLATPSFVSAVTTVITAAFTGTISAALAWSSGLRNAVVMNEVADRFAYSRKHLSSGADAVSIKLYPETASQQNRKVA